MSLAERISALDPGSVKPWLLKANRYGPGIACTLLVLAIAWQLAQTTWRLLPSAAPDDAPPVVSATQRSSSEQSVAEFAALRNAHPFGQPPADTGEFQPVADTIDAPETTLNLELTGVLVHDRPEKSMASIVSGSGRNSERHYSIGATIDNTNASLHEVHYDRVILSRAGSYESLPLRRFTDASTLSRSRTNALAARPAPTNNNATLRTTISENAARFTDIIRLAPQVEGGEVVGFRINPGRDEDTFESLGLQAGDVVTDINGIQLNDASRGLQAFEALGESTSANVTVLREGVPQVIVVNTAQIESLTEDRQ